MRNLAAVEAIREDWEENPRWRNVRRDYAAADANDSLQMYPDQSLHAVSSVPSVVRRIDNALQRIDQIHHAEGFFRVRNGFEQTVSRGPRGLDRGGTVPRSRLAGAERRMSATLRRRTGIV